MANITTRAVIAAAAAGDADADVEEVDVVKAGHNYGWPIKEGTFLFDANGFVTYPNVDTAAQITDLMGASRAYSVNATAAQAAKQSALDALELGR